MPSLGRRLPTCRRCSDVASLLRAPPASVERTRPRGSRPAATTASQNPTETVREREPSPGGASSGQPGDSSPGVWPPRRAPTTTAHNRPADAPLVTAHNRPADAPATGPHKHPSPRPSPDVIAHPTLTIFATPASPSRCPSRPDSFMCGPLQVAWPAASPPTSRVRPADEGMARRGDHASRRQRPLSRASGRCPLGGGRG